MPTQILILGAGVIGLTSAYVLAQAGHRVTVLDRGPTGGESTWAGAGILSPLLPWDYGPAVNDLALRGSRLWPDWAGQLHRQSGIDPEYLPSGMLASGLTDAAATQQWCGLHGWAATRPPAHIANLLGRDEQALWLPEVGQMRNPRLAQALAGGLQNMSVTILANQPLVELLTNKDRVSGVRTAQGIIEADFYILAAGAWSQSLLGARAAGLQITPVRGQILLFQAEPGLLPCIVYKQGHYLVPRADGHILAGSTLEQVGFDKRTTETAGQELLAFARGILPVLDESRIVRHWAGLRPGSPENIPTIARHPELANLYANTGHFRYGVTMAPASAEILAAMISGSPCPIDPSPYRWPGASEQLDKVQTPA
ncbi:glycine oxidase [Sulfuritortus calidifontis]|uniref:Glycine oxidase n=1 Tax=Sulfuritortus calidifontis TaxID=1914471 RepID=A0A4R3JWV7_9PROT|nr:glycine oxidase ThiO [Sulfuritortus calidifontis]TCS72709.1 glycine oxidase [Sulfuritortus calidifontis]